MFVRAIKPLAFGLDTSKGAAAIS
eukprot:SAG31_NODE_43879_length_265_cov_0.626506_1_plen_23_part_10